MEKVTPAASSVCLVGGTAENFKTSKLPSQGEVLKVLFNYHSGESMSLKDSIDKTASLLLPIWVMARVPTKAAYHVIKHICKLHAERQELKKCINRKSATNLTNQQTFQDSLDDLFDTAHRDALSLIKIEENHLFLKAQCERVAKKQWVEWTDPSL